MAAPTSPLLVTGATGTLGQAFRRVCGIRGLQVVLLDRAALDIADAATVNRALRTHQPWAVINAAGYVRVEAAERIVSGQGGHVEVASIVGHGTTFTIYWARRGPNPLAAAA